jgi:hypothetical protein
MRHKIVHDYLFVDQDIVWQVVSVDLPDLVKCLEKVGAEYCWLARKYRRLSLADGSLDSTMRIPPRAGCGIFPSNSGSPLAIESRTC